MFNKFCRLFIVLTSFSTFAQINGIIKDNTTKKPIPYVNIWVEGQSTGTTADENGNFSLPETDGSKSIIFSAVGYGKKSLKAGETSGILYLLPQAIELNEVVIESGKNTHEITIGSLKNAEKNHYFGINGAKPWMHANFYPYKPEYATAPYLKAIKVISETEHKGASFNVRLYNVGENGEPGDFLYDENIICYPKKGKRTHTVDLSKLNIPFPENGIFIAVEWLVIDQNRYEVTIKSNYDTSGNITKPKYEKGNAYTPIFLITYADEEIIPWLYADGKWLKSKKSVPKSLGGIAMELILTN